MSWLSRFKAWFWPRRTSNESPGLFSLRRMLAVAGFSCAMLFAADQPLTMTDQHRSVSMPIDGTDLAAAPPILDVDVTAVSNPNLVPLGVAVFVVAGDRKIPLGNFAFYPPDHKGVFHLSSKAAFARVGRSKEAHLVFELQKLRATAEWKPVSVTLSPPKWRREPRQ